MTTASAAPTTTSAETESQKTAGEPTWQRQGRRVVDMAMTPVNVARRALPAKGGAPLYLGLAGLAAVGVVEWPVAVAGGLGYAGYAVLHGGKIKVQLPEAESQPGGNGQAGPGPSEKK